MGTWNTAILNPQWVGSNIFQLPAGTDLPVEIAFGAITNTRYIINDLSIIPTMDRLIINPKKHEDSLYKQVDVATSKLYELLPHTPISGVGDNFTYLLEENENFAFESDFNEKEFKNKYDTLGLMSNQTSMLQHSLSSNADPHLILNLSFKIKGNRQFLRMNYHYQVDNNNEKIKHALSKYYANYQHSQLILSEFLRKDNK